MTLWDPWATLVAHGFKRYETRGWFIKHRGPLALHCAKRWETGQMDLCRTGLFERYLRDIDPIVTPYPPPQYRGCVIAVVSLVECVRIDSRFRDMIRNTVGPQEIEFGGWEDGRFAWKLVVMETFFDDPIPARGQQGLWRWDRNGP